MNSDFDECEPGRRVKLFYVVPGFGTSRAVGKGKTKANGTYSITEKNPKGKYFTSVKPRRINLPNGDTILCRKGRSKQVKG